MFEAMADAFALAGSVLKQDLQLAETQTFAGHLKTERANLQRIFFRTAARAAGMHDEVIDPERYRALDLFAKRFDRLQQNDFVSRGQINEVVRVDENRRDLCFFVRFAKELD